MEKCANDAVDGRARLEALAAAIADGEQLDWVEAGAALIDVDERELADNLRAIASMNGLTSTSRDVFSSTSRSPLTDRPARLAPGTTWGSLRIVAHLGAGRFGDVHRAFDPALDREVALKLVRDAGADSQVVAEGRLMARVHHPNVVTIYGAQRIDDVSGLWMELIDGRTLEAELDASGLFSARELIRVGVELAHALDAVHRAHLVHRDVKAQNVLRDRSGRIVLGDFGTGRELQEVEPGRGGLAGTPAYLAPEHFEGGALTLASDIYSLGVLLFHLATSRYPVPGRSLGELKEAHARKERTALVTLRSDLPTTLVAVIERALESDPARRFPTAGGVVEALASCAAPPQPANRRLSLTGSVAALALAVAAVGDGATGRADLPFGATGGTRPTLLIAAFENATGERRLDGSVEFALERELATGQSLHVASRFRVQDTLALMRLPPDTRIDVDLAREVAVRDGGIQALITGRIDQRGTGFRLDTEIRHPADGRVLAGLSESIPAETEILEAVGRLARRVRRRMGETVADLQGNAASPLPRLTTSSLRALQIYAQVERMETDEGLYYGGEKSAERLLQEAVAEDPSFAMAHHLLSIVARLDGELTGRPRLEEALAHIDRAVALSASVSPAERIRNELQRDFVLYGMEGDGPEGAARLQGAIAGCEALLELDPNNEEGARGCNGLYEQAQAYNESIVTRLADRRPRAPQSQMAAAIAILETDPGALERAKPFVQRAAQLEPTGIASAAAVADARLFAAREAWLENRPEDALRIADALAAEMVARPAEVQAGFARALWPEYVELGRLRQAEELARYLPHSRGRRTALTVIAVNREDKAQLRQLLTRLWPKPEELYNAATPFIEAGMAPESRRLLAMHRSWKAGSTRNATQYARMLEGGVALIEGRPGLAIERFQTFLENRKSSPHPSREARVRLSLADAWMAQGEIAPAIAVLEGTTPRQISDLIWGNVGADWMRNCEYLARLYRRVGRISEADGIERELRTLLAVADDDHPIKRRLTAQVH